MQSFCTYFNSGLCKSCSQIESPYPLQLKRKEERLIAALSFVSALSPQESVRSPLQGFRNRAKMVVTGTVGAPMIGLAGESQLDQGRALLDCPIHHPKLNQVIQALPEWIQKFNLIPYQISAQSGELKGIILYYSEEANQLYLRFVLRSKECVSRLKKMLPAFQARFPEVVCLSANIQPIPHAILEGPEEIFISDERHISYQLGNLTLRLSPQAFVQTNSAVAVRLYQTAAEWIGEVGSKKMLELYSGQGAFSFSAAQQVPEILGIELNHNAVDTANQTARELGLNSLRFECADATRVNPIALQFKPDLVLVNPPRRGLGEAVGLLQALLPEHFIYSSCSVESLAQDLKVLSTLYQIEKIQIFDLFPHTEHFETLVLLKRLSKE